MTIQEKIEKEIKGKIIGFHPFVFEKIETMLEVQKEVEIWLEQGMGRKHLISYPVGQHKSSFPIQNYLCNLKI